jgi:hypothetical protein
MKGIVMLFTKQATTIDAKKETKSMRDKFEDRVMKTVEFVDRNPKLALTIGISVPQIVGYTVLAIVTRP